MKDYLFIKQTKREFIREKRRNIREARKILNELHCGCAIYGIFGSRGFKDAVYEMKSALTKMDNITKPLR